MTRNRYVTSAIAGVLCLLVSTHSVTGQIQDRQSKDSADLIVDGRVEGVFRDGDSGRNLVQILVQRSEAPRLDERGGNTRFPAPGEYVYAHVNVQDSRSGRASRRSETTKLPEPEMYIRAYLSSGERGQWEGNTPNWFEETSRGDGTGRRDSQFGNNTRPGTSNRARSLGISSERVSLGLRSALKVTLVAPGSPAAKAGIEPGDILVKANNASITSPEQLAAALRKSGDTLTLTVRDVRTGRDVPVNVALETAGPSRQPSTTATPSRKSSRKSLGLVTELAFYGGEAAIKVTEVKPESPAQRAGIEPGLLILKVNGKRILHPDKLVEAERGATGTLKLDVVDPTNRRERAVQVDLNELGDIFR